MSSLQTQERLKIRLTAVIELLILGFIGDVIMTYAINPLEDTIRRKTTTKKENRKK